MAVTAAAGEEAMGTGMGTDTMIEAVSIFKR
jgi:hypothetical protein